MIYAFINFCLSTQLLTLSGAISSEEIIKYAHRISASNAVCAPLTWVPGKNTSLFTRYMWKFLHKKDLDIECI